MPPRMGGRGPRKSNTSTPAPIDEGPTLVDRLNYADLPRPFKSTTFVSKLPGRTASGASATGFKKNVKQILTLERERCAARARGEPVEPPKKKKKENPIGKPKPNKGRRSGISTPLTLDDESVMSGTATPNDYEPEEVLEVYPDPAGVIHREIITYNTPAAPPSLLPAKKYCDITGLHAAYTDPRTKLRYKGLEVWHVVRNLGPGVDQSYLSLRGAQTSLK